MRLVECNAEPVAENQCGKRCLFLFCPLAAEFLFVPVNKIHSRLSDDNDQNAWFILALSLSFCNYLEYTDSVEINNLESFYCIACGSNTVWSTNEVVNSW